MTDLPFAIRNDHLLVRAGVEGGSLTLVFDTGVSTTTLSRSASNRVHLEVDERPVVRIEGVGGWEVGGIATPRHFTLGTLHGSHLRFLVGDLGLDFADGLLSTDFLSHYDIDFDVPDRQIRLFGFAGNCDSPHAFLDGDLYRLPMEYGLQDRLPRVPVVVNGEKLVALVDTGAASSSLFEAAARRVGISRAMLARDEAGMIAGVGGSRVARRHVLSEVTLGDLTIRNMPVAVIDVQQPPGIDMLLGLDFLSRVHLWLSYSSRSVVLQYPPHPSPPLPPEDQH